MDTKEPLASRENSSDIHLDIQSEFHAMLASLIEEVRTYDEPKRSQNLRSLAIHMTTSNEKDPDRCRNLQEVKQMVFSYLSDQEIQEPSKEDVMDALYCAFQEPFYGSDIPMPKETATLYLKLTTNGIPASKILQEWQAQAELRAGSQHLLDAAKEIPVQLASLIEDARTYDAPERTRCLKALAVHMTPSEFQDPNRFTNLQEAEQMVSSYLSARNIQAPSKENILDALSFAFHEPIHYEDSQMSREAAKLYLKLDNEGIPASKILREWQAKAELQAGIQYFLDAAKEIGLTKTAANETVMELLRQAGEKHRTAER